MKYYTTFALALTAVTLVAAQIGCQSNQKNNLAYSGQSRTPAFQMDGKDWNEYGGIRTADRMGEKYSPLEEINKGNVKRLKKLWVYNTGEKDMPGPKSLEVTPVYHNGKLFGCTIFNKVFALDADTGVPVWERNPNVRKSDKVWAYKCRGVSIWKDSQASGGLCSTRIFSNTIDGRILAFDSETGKSCPDFIERDRDANGQPVVGAAAGEVSPWINVMSPHPSKEDRLAHIRKEKDHPFRDEYYITSAPLIFKDLVIVGGGITDNGRVDATAGAVQAFHARTGQLMWSWDPAPKALTSKSTPLQPLTYGTPNVWAPMAADDSRGLIFLPTGAAAPDYFGANRNGKDQYANSVIALRVEENGNLLAQPRIEWQFKTVIQDKWDYDVASQPVLTELQVNGETVPVVLQGTKMGFIFIMHRDTGKPIFPTKNGVVGGNYQDLLREVTIKGVVTEESIAMNKSDFITETADGKVTYVPKTSASHSRHQPFPPAEWQLHDTPNTKLGLLGQLALVNSTCRDLTKKYDYNGIYTPPTLRGGINFPGAVGGIDWGGVTVDPVNQILYVNQIRVATITQLIKRDEYTKAVAAAGPAGPKAFKEAYFDMLGTPYGLHRFPYIDSVTKLPCSDPPYGTLKAISLKDGKLLWEKTFGDFAEMSNAIAAQKELLLKAHTGDIASVKDQSAVKDLLKKALAKAGSLAKAGVINIHSLSAGVPNFGGSMVSRGGILFIAAAADSKFRMYDSKTGELIHEIALDQFKDAGSGAATPMTFVSNQNRQVIVVASGGNKFIPGKQGDAIIAFALE